MPATTIYLNLLDADRCVYNKDLMKYLRAQIDERTFGEDFDKDIDSQLVKFIKDNPKLIADIVSRMTKENQTTSTHYLGSLSLRQSAKLDARNGKFPFSMALLILLAEVQKQCPKHKIEVNDYLLSDTYGQQPAGENAKLIRSSYTEFRKNESESPEFFTQALYDEWLMGKMREIIQKDGKSFGGVFIDESKLLIVLAQIHQLALKNPGAEIICTCYDDLKDMLMDLKTIFELCPRLLPDNVTLVGKVYDGSPIVEKFNVKGTGKVLENFAQVMRDIPVALGYRTEANKNEIYSYEERGLDNIYLARMFLDDLELLEKLIPSASVAISNWGPTSSNFYSSASVPANQSHISEASCEKGHVG